MNSTKHANFVYCDMITDKEKIKSPIENIGVKSSTSIKCDSHFEPLMPLKNNDENLIDSCYFCDIIDYMNGLYSRKNKDYGNSFDLSLDEFGLIASAIRLSDKFNRFKSLIKPNATQNVKDESIRDTLVDMANYCIMTIMYINKTENKCG